MAHKCKTVAFIVLLLSQLQSPVAEATNNISGGLLVIDPSLVQRVPLYGVLSELFYDDSGKAQPNASSLATSIVPVLPRVGDVCRSNAEQLLRGITSREMWALKGVCVCCGCVCVCKLSFFMYDIASTNNWGKKHQRATSLGCVRRGAQFVRLGPKSVARLRGTVLVPERGAILLAGGAHPENHGRPADRYEGTVAGAVSHGFLEFQ